VRQLSGSIVPMAKKGKRGAAPKEKLASQAKQSESTTGDENGVQQAGAAPDALEDERRRQDTPLSVPSARTASADTSLGSDVLEARDGTREEHARPSPIRDSDWSSVRASVAAASRRSEQSSTAGSVSGMSFSDMISVTDIESFGDADRERLRDARATSNRRRALVNVLKCSFGCGVLGLPYAFKQVRDPQPDLET
jgi:hypothetical protein